jgi:hypothetical protein
MGLFDVVTTKATCPFCGAVQEWRVQFKYGSCRQHEFKPGDRIQWSDPPSRAAPKYDYGANVGGFVRTAGIAENSCATCGRDGVEAVVLIKENVVQGIELLEEPAFLGGEGYQQVADS